MKTFAVFLIFPALITAKINIAIVASDDKLDRQVHVSGSNVDLITNEERETFQLTHENLKNAVNAYFGSMPDDVYLKSPTPWGDLYTTNEWKQVSRVLKPLRARILAVTYETPLVYSDSFNNTSTKSATFTAKIRQDVENTVSSTWQRNGELSAHQDIVYGFDIKAMAVSGKATFSYVSRWGEDVVKSQTVTVGSETGVEIALEPNQAVTAKLYARRGSMKVEIDYEATLMGSVAVNYANLYKDHHFWSIDINKVMDAGKMNKSVKSSEVIELGFYMDSTVEIHDFDTKNVISVLPMKVF